MSNTIRGVVYLFVIQSGFSLTQFLSSFGGFFSLVGLYVIMPLIITELHYRYISADNKGEFSLTAATPITGVWIIAGSILSILLYKLLPGHPLQQVLFSDGLGMVLLKQMSLIVIASLASLLMFRAVNKVLYSNNFRSALT